MKTSCKGCPINITSNEGEMANYYGCLPSYGDAIKWYNDTGKVWACHSNPNKACNGFLIVAEHYGYKIEINENTQLITEKHSVEDIYNKE